ncbi:hypothetical protein H5410_043786, partial [Solanum commersonii]
MGDKEPHQLHIEQESRTHMRIQPTDQTSIAPVYSEQLRSNSGARYQRVTTYSVMKSVSEVVLANPKSPILRSQFAFRNKLLGLRSR